MEIQRLAAAIRQMRITAPDRRLLGSLRDWLVVAWVVWWTWAYVQHAMAHRFPHLLGWTRTFW